MTMMFAKYPGRDSGPGERFGAGAVAQAGQSVGSDRSQHQAFGCRPEEERDHVMRTLHIGDRAYSEKHDTRRGALSEEDDLMAHLQKRVNNRKEQQS